MKQLRAFESGSVSFRLFYMQPEVISEVAARGFGWPRYAGDREAGHYALVWMGGWDALPFHVDV